MESLHHALGRRGCRQRFVKVSLSHRFWHLAELWQFEVNVILGIFEYLRHYYRASHLKDENRGAILNYVDRMKSGDVGLQDVSCPNCRVCDDELLFSRDRYGIPWNTVVCRACGMLYSNPQMTPVSTTQFYASDDYRRIYGSGDLLRDSTEKFQYEHIDRTDEYHQLTHFDFVMDSGVNIESVAEIGAGGGWNLVPFINEGIHCQGYDFSPQLIEAGRKRGIDMLDLSESVLSGRYDLIMLRHVLEHVDDPINQLLQLSSHLTADGRLFIEVPGIVEKIPSLQNAHYHYFSEVTLHSVLGQAGFEITHRKVIQRNGYLLVMAKHSGIAQPPTKCRAEYQRVMGVVSRGRRGMFKATLVESLPSPMKRALVRLRNR